MKQPIVKICVITAFCITGLFKVNGQALPEELRQGTIIQQYDYIENRTRIYENFRAIREDMFQALMNNTLDTLDGAMERINSLIIQTGTLDDSIASLQDQLEATNDELTEMTETKNSISVLGLEVNKTTYNSIMWSILLILLILLGGGYLMFKQNRAVTLRTKKDLTELKDEFADYQTQSRLNREKMTRDHFNEIQKLKGK